MRSLENKVALVTGAAKNVGFSIALELAERGATVIVNFFHSADAAKVAQATFRERGYTLHVIRASVARPEQVRRMFDEVADRYGRLDILVNNAADGALLPADQVGDAELDRAWNTNLKGALHCSRAAAPLMAKAGGGAIVNISTLGGGQLVMANYLACAPAKAAVEVLTRYLAVQYAALGIRVNTAASGMLESEVADAFPDASSMQRTIVEATPLGRLGRALDLARVVAFLASPDSSWITGQMIIADGGLSLGSAMLSPRQGARAEAESAPAPAHAEPAETARQLRTAPARVESNVAADDVVVVGMGLAVPGANSPDEYWALLKHGPHQFVQVPQNRWDFRGFCASDHAAPDKSYQSISAFITNFEPIAGSAPSAGPRAELTTQWLRHSLVQALSCVSRRAEDRFTFMVGYTPDGSQSLEEASVIASWQEQLDAELRRSELGSSEQQELSARFAQVLRQRYPHGAGRSWESLPHRVGGNALAGILPDTTEVQMVDTACSSSLYAIDLGAKSLRAGTADIAACGGAFSLGPLGAILFAKLNGLSSAGVVRSLDKRADGVLFADGAGVVILKLRSRAEADGDAILGVLSSFGASSDGQGKAIYAPSSSGQALAIRRAFKDNEELREDVGWIVAHATGTPAGDLAEFVSLRETMANDHPIAVTSNKSIIGHTGWAAGVVSLIQVLTALRERQIPAQFEFAGSPQSFGGDTTQLVIPTRTEFWQAGSSGRRTACVSGFGFGGTNAHLVVSEYDSRPATPRSVPHRRSEPLVVVAWGAHFPGLSGRAEVQGWLSGQGKAPDLSWGRQYPLPSFQKVRMPPSAARTVDRTQLMVLECAHQVKEQIGAAWSECQPTTGVFIGHMGSTRNAALYAARCYNDDLLAALRESESAAALLPHVKRARAALNELTIESNENSFPGMMPNVIAARVANQFNLHGPNMTLDAGFASALCAFDAAREYLLSGEIELALVGGINGNSTAAMAATCDSSSPGSRASLAEGGVLFGLMLASTAERLNVPVLATVESPSLGDVEARTLSCGFPTLLAGHSYLGAEAAVAVLRALLVSDGQPIAVQCAEDGEKRQRRVIVRAASQHAQVAPATSAAPLELDRQVSEWLPHPVLSEPREGGFLMPGAWLVTNVPERLLEVEARSLERVKVISTVPVPATVRALGIDIVELALSTENADALFASLGASSAHLRVLSDIAVACDAEAPWVGDSASLLYLHDVAFLALQRCFEAISVANGSFATLLLGAEQQRSLHPWVGLFSGLTKTARLELSQAKVVLIAQADGDLARGLEYANVEWGCRQLLPVVYYDWTGTRRVERLRQLPGETSSSGEPLGEHSVVVAVGGARGITAEIVKALASKYRPTLYLLGSNDLSAHDPEITLGSDEDFAKTRKQYLATGRAADPSSSIARLNAEFDRRADARRALQNVQEIEQLSGRGKVHYLRCDILLRPQVEAVFAGILAKHAKIDLLINAAGLNRSSAIPVKPLAVYRSVRDVKVRGYMNLRHALRAAPPRLWCNFGSFIGFSGQLGEADYASANDFLAKAAAFSRDRGRDEFTLGWTLWKSVGLGANPVTRAFLERSGTFTGMTTEEGIHHFLHELSLKTRTAVSLPLGAREKAAIEYYIPEFFRAPESKAQPLAEAEHARRFYVDRILHRTDSELVAERVFDDQRDGFLVHHAVNGEPTLPGTFVVEIASELAQLACPGFRLVAIEDLEFTRFLRAYPGRPTSKQLRARVTERSQTRAEVAVTVSTDIRSPSGRVLSRDVVHFTCKAILHREQLAPLLWTPWDPAEEIPVLDPYHAPSSPVRLTRLFQSTTATRLHPFGKRATFLPQLAEHEAALSLFETPAILLDAMARTLVLNPLFERYVPLAAPLSIGRVELYQQTNDVVLARQHGIELYATPRSFDWHEAAPVATRHVAVDAAGWVIAQMKNVRGRVFGYIDERTGQFITPDEFVRLTRGSRPTFGIDATRRLQSQP